jgi:hypothetical protein
VFENRALWSRFGPKREEVAGGWRTLHNEELRNLNASPNIIRVIKLRGIRWAGHLAPVGEMSVYKTFLGKHEWKRPFRRPRHRWQDNTETCLR